MKLILLLTLLTGCRSFFIPSLFKAIQNKALVHVFKKMTSDSNWPTTPPSKLKTFDYYDPSTIIPPYYEVDFHAYTGGNMNPEAARDSRSANSAVFSHHYDDKSGEEASDFIRSVQSKRTLERTNPGGSKVIVDFGCGIGISTQYLRDTFPDDLILGVDLSPPFLQETRGVNAIFAHRDIAHTTLPDNFVDIVSISYVLHEMPYMESLRVLREAYRILKPGGTLNVLDMVNPVASSPVMSFIFDRTEPYLTDYKEFIDNKDTDLKSIGFYGIESCLDYPKTIMFSAVK